MQNRTTVSWLTLSVLLIATQPAVAEAPSTATFMNVLTVCGAGSNIKIDANLKGSLKSLYEGEATQGRAVQDIIPKIAEQLPDGKSYELYLACVEKFLLK